MLAPQESSASVAHGQFWGRLIALYLLGCICGLPTAALAGASGRSTSPSGTASQGRPGHLPDLERTLIKDLRRCLVGVTPTETWKNPRIIDGHLRGNGRSANHGRMARAVQTCVAPEEKVGSSQLNALQWWTAIEELERGRYGHRYEELGAEYEAWSGLSEAVVVWKTGQRDHPAARMLLRELLLFAIAARPIEERSKWRPIYRGHGRRVAGLRKLPWAWSLTTDSYFYTKILDLPVQIEPVRRPPEIELAEALVPRVRAVLGDQLLLLQELALDPSKLRNRIPELRKQAQELRSIQPYLVVRELTTDSTFSALLGPLRGRNTAPTRAILTQGPLLAEAEFSYPFLDDLGKPRRRVRGDQELDSGGGEIVRTKQGALAYRSWNRGPDVTVLALPKWVPESPEVEPCNTLGIWLFPDREPSLWLGPECSSN